ncbi:MAG: M23 family peptidase [Acidobacteria bacterium]|nr:MAG: M23 family peptidase [Acidobacteriota bacterium]
MDDDKRCYTLIVASAADSRFRKLIIRRWHLYLSIVAGTVYVFLQAGFFIDYYRVRVENRNLKQEHAAVLQTLQSRLASIEAESARLRQLAGEMGLNLDVAMDSEAEKREAGMGGPSELDSFANELDRVAAHLKLLRENLWAERARTTPNGWPARGHVTSGYGLRRNPFGPGYEFHAGVDIASLPGRPVRATADGVVIYAGYRGGYGKLVVVDHGRGWRTFYGHLSRIHVKVGQAVRRGQTLGRVGRTGRSTGAHVHYEVRIHDRPIDPAKFLDSSPRDGLEGRATPPGMKRAEE